MIKFVLERAIEEYKSNFKVMLVFGMLLFFVVIFLFFQQFIISSGTIFVIYNESILSIIGLILGLVFLFFFSFFISLTVYSIKRDVQKMSFDIYWNEIMKKSAIKIFLFYFFLSVFVYIFSLIGLYFDLSILVAFIVFLASAALMYVPQSIVLDELDIFPAIKNSLVFWSENFVVSFLIILLSSFILLLFILIEFVLEFFLLPGIFVSFFLVLIFLIPFIEQTKSYAFVLKFNLIKQTEILSAEVKPKPKVKIDALRLRDKKKGGKI
jgi:hypothetical protein